MKSRSVRASAFLSKAGALTLLLSIMQTKPAWWYRQSGVIAYRRKTDLVELEVLLITSKKRKRWIIPKGIIDPGLSPQESALKGAFEEAGIKGKIDDWSIGEYTREKWGGTCVIVVFLLEVTEMFDAWPESSVRKREWVRVQEAIRRVEEPQLQVLFRQLSD